MSWKGTAGKFGVVGIVGFCVDGLVLEGLLEIGVNPLIGQFYAACVAILVTFILNRTYTFGDTETPIFRLFIGYLGTQGVGFGVNYATYALLLKAAPLPLCSPLVALTVAAGVAMVFTYTGSRVFVFKTSVNGSLKNARPDG